ncbi:MAG: sugar-binding protein, partial [Planctomycetota bacterium]
MCRKLILLTTFIVALGIVGDASAQPADGEIRQAWAPPVIDGKIDSLWNVTPAYPLDEWQAGDAATIQDDLDFSATWRALWDSTRLYILADVNDAELVSDS